MTWPLVLNSDMPWSIPLGLILTSVGFCLHPLAALGHNPMDLLKIMSKWTALQRQLLNALAALFTVVLSSMALLSPSSNFTHFQTADISLPAFLLVGIQLCSSFFLRWIGMFSSVSKLEFHGLTAPLTLAPALALLPISLLAWLCPPHLSVFDGVICPSSPSNLEYALLPFIFIVMHAAQCWILRSIPSPTTHRIPILHSTFLSSSTLLHNLLPKAENTRAPGRPSILGCATMWHETGDEMRALLTSVFKVDKDQRLPKNKDNFRWEVHVLFDDAIHCNPITKEIVPNKYLGMFCDEMKSLMVSYSPGASLEDAEIMKTPYGGLIVWMLPGGSVLFCHLKEKAVIKNKKRWSQCMYFLYFLGHPRLPPSPYKFDQPMDNTFILALDGDVEFNYQGVLRLIEVLFYIFDFFN